MRIISIYITLCLLLPNLSWSQATSPSISKQPVSKSLSCETVSILDSLTTWYNSYGGMEVRGDAPLTIKGTMSLDSAKRVFHASSKQLCGNTKRLDLQFVVTDVRGQATVSEVAVFKTEDNTKPRVTVLPQAARISCASMARDSFVSWIRSHGGATAVDNCSDVTWTDFIWNDSKGNNGTASIDKGPYPPFLSGCTFSYNIAFIVKDACGNEEGTLTSFTVVDDVAPTFSGSYQDTTILCSQKLPTNDVRASDPCDPSPQVTFVERDNRVANIDSCGHYRYKIQRTWMATDACGNRDSIAQIIQVVDTLPPTATVQDTIQLGCGTYVQDSVYMTVGQGCGKVNVTFRDTTVSNVQCVHTIRRDYTLTNICGNTQQYTQYLQVIDTMAPVFVTAPSDYFVGCDTVQDARTHFNQWLSTLQATEVKDACTDAFFAIAKQGSYVLGDTTTYRNKLPKYEDSAACGSTGFGKALTQVVDVIVYDACGNTKVHKVEFAVIDNTPPQIESCVENLILSSSGNNCLADVAIPVPKLKDTCSDKFGNTNYSHSISINGGSNFNIKGDGRDTLRNIAQGDHILRYTIRDCSGNKASCDFRLKINDGLPPTLTCPATRQDTISGDSCIAKVALSKGISVSDNCTLETSYRQQQPKNSQDALLQFVVSEGDTSIQNKSYTFSETKPILYGTLQPQLIFDVVSAAGTVFTIFGEDNTPLHVHTASKSCSRETLTINLNLEQYNQWAIDGELGVAISIDYIGSGICDALQNSKDGVSSLQATLVYSDANVEYKITGSTSVDRKVLSPKDSTSLSVGENIITYYAKDNAGNTDSCRTVLTVVDPALPSVKCKDIRYEVAPRLAAARTLTAENIDGGTTDNCGLDTLFVRNGTLSCQLYNQEVSRTLVAVDKAGNIDSCSATIKVVPITIEPSYTSGVCQGDTIRMFANVPDDTSGTVYTYKWSGPNFSSTLQNPFIANASAANNGPYTVTITGDGGCSTSATVNIMTSILTTPKLSLDNRSDTICADQQVVLQTDSYTGDITYLWYEGLFPNGRPIGETAQPSFILSPTSGSHNYYVVAKSRSCSSNPSGVLNILAVDPPEVVLGDQFLNICEGSNISLSTSTLGNQYTYAWSGPNEYNSDRPIPPVIENASSIHQGTYALTVSIGGCASAPATTKVSIFSKPETPIITGEDHFCENSSFTLTVNNVPQADKYKWYLNGVLFTVTDENRLFIPNTNPNLEGKWQVSLETGKCVSDRSEEKQVNVNNLSSITASFTGNPCAGDTIQLLCTYVTDARYSWTGPGGFMSTLQNPKIVAIPGEYIVTATTPSQCTTTTSVNIATQNAPTITALSTDVNNCMNANDSIVFFPSIVPADASHKYLWNGPNNFVSADKRLVIRNLDSKKKGTYTLTVYKGQCASNTFHVDVDYTLYPTKPKIIVEGNACVGDTFALATKDAEGLNYLWTTPKGEVITDTAKLVIKNASDTHDWAYTLTTIKNNCRSPLSDTLMLDVVPTPKAGTLQHNGPLCIGDTLRIMGKTPYAYKWYKDTALLSSDNALVIVDITVDVLSQYSYSITEQSCTSPRYNLGQEVILYDQLPQPILDQTTYNVCKNGKGGTSLCIREGYIPNTTYTLTNFVSKKEIAMWRDSCVTLTDDDNFQLGNNILVLKANRNGCSSMDSPKINIRVSEIPDLKVAVANNPYHTCTDSITVASIHGSPTVDLSWSKIDTDISITPDGDKKANIKGIKKGKNSVLLTYSSGGCVNFAQDSVVIYGEYEPEATDDSYITKVEKSITLDILSNDKVPHLHTISIVEKPKRGSIREVDKSLVYIPSDGYAGTDQARYQLCGTACDTCVEARISIEVDDGNVCTGINVITPNGDNINDALIFPCLSDGKVEGSLTIFNQWGTEVYRSDNYQNDWKGTHNNQNLPVGTYYYILEANGGKSIVKDYIIIQR